VLGLVVGLTPGTPAEPETLYEAVPGGTKKASKLDNQLSMDRRISAWSFPGGEMAPGESSLRHHLEDETLDAAGVETALDLPMMILS